MARWMCQRRDKGQSGYKDKARVDREEAFKRTGVVSEEKRICPSCQGKGRVFFAVTLLSPIFWLIAPFERNDKNGVTREVCGQCGGDGYVAW